MEGARAQALRMKVLLNSPIGVGGIQGELLALM